MARKLTKWPNGRRPGRDQQTSRARSVEQRFYRGWHPLAAAADWNAAEPGEFCPELLERDAAAPGHQRQAPLRPP
jgi:hypothetical protein